MPASTPVDLHNGLTAEVEPIEDDREVYFTDEAPAFRLILRNESNLDFASNSGFRWYLAVGQGMPRPFHSDYIKFELEEDEQKVFEIGNEVLAFEGHGVIGISHGNVNKPNDSTYRMKVGGKKYGEYDPLYSFSVWDRSQYETQHEYPQRLQRLAVYLTAGIVVFSILSLLVAFINLLVTLINLLVTLLEAGII